MKHGVHATKYVQWNITEIQYHSDYRHTK